MAEPHPPGNNNTMITRMLPSEILFFQILPRLPVKSVPNVMCVCKKWYLFLKSGAFATTYHHHVLTNDDHQNHHKHLVLSTTKRSEFHSIDCETPQDGLTAVRNLRYIVPIYGRMSILTSLHGLLCVGTIDNENSQEYHGLILWNPLTGEYKTLSKPNKGCDPHKECYKICKGIFGLYYISSDDDDHDYRLLCVTHHLNIYIYSLKSNSWRKVDSTEDFRQRASNWILSGSYLKQPSHILLDEKLYFLKQVSRQGTFIQSFSIMRFDTKTEKFTEIAIPSFGNQMTNCLGFMVLKGCIHFCVAILIKEENYMANQKCYETIELWRMDRDGDWTKVLTYGPMSFSLWGRSIVLHLMRDEKLLIQHQGDVYILDMKKHTKEMVFTCQTKDFEIPVTGKYIETTVSPNQYEIYVQKWFFTINGLEWCTVRSWGEYNAFERNMLEKYGEDITQHTGDDAELWALIQRGGNDQTFGIGSSSTHEFMATGTSPFGFRMSSIEYVQSQLQIRELQIQLEMERKARNDMQAQISELMCRFSKHN